MKKIFCLIAAWNFCTVWGQDSSAITINQPLDSGISSEKVIDTGSAVLSNPGKPEKKRVIIVAAGNAAFFTGSMIALYNTWYSAYPQTNFHFFDDNGEWLQVDKIGHAFTAYSISRVNMETIKWAGLKRKHYIWYGGLSGAAYQTMIETFDGFSSHWGWSWGDFGANIFGSSLLVSQQLIWDEQRITMKFSFHSKDYGTEQLNGRADDIYGNKLLERMLKDYNGQAYWLSGNLKSFFKKSNLPPWLNIAFGYGADDMFGALYNNWTDENGVYIVHDTDRPRYRQFYLAPDIDLTKIKTKSKFLRTTFSLLNSFKFPAPAIEFSQGKIKGHWIYF